MNPRRRKFVDRIGYDNWDPFQKPNDPLDVRLDVTKRTTQRWCASSSSSRPPGTNSTATTTVAACWNALWVL